MRSFTGSGGVVVPGRGMSAPAIFAAAIVANYAARDLRDSWIVTDFPAASSQHKAVNSGRTATCGETTETYLHSASLSNGFQNTPGAKIQTAKPQQASHNIQHAKTMVCPP